MFYCVRGRGRGRGEQRRGRGRGGAAGLRVRLLLPLGQAGVRGLQLAAGLGRGLGPRAAAHQRCQGVQPVRRQPRARPRPPAGAGGRGGAPGPPPGQHQKIPMQDVPPGEETGNLLVPQID